MSRHPTLLLRALRANAAFSGISGTALVALPSWWAGLIGALDAPAYGVLGAGLLAFAGLVAWTSVDLEARWPVVRWIIGADVLWVVATPPVMLLGASRISLEGRLLLIVVAAAVAVLAMLQWRGLGASGDVTAAPDRSGRPRTDHDP